MKLSARREQQADAPAGAEPVRHVARATGTPVTASGPVPSGPAPSGPGPALAGNAAMQRLAAGRGAHPLGLAALSAGGGHALHRLQTKLTVSRPGDPFERQAEAIAAQVGAREAAPGPAPAISRLLTPAAAAGGTPPDAAASGGATLPPGLEALIRAPGAGSALPAETRARIEPHLGVALDGVQVHSDGGAQAAAGQLGARAFTTGNHIFLGPGESAADVSLMAHEATHVAQQQAGPHRSTVHRSPDDDGILPDFVLEELSDLAHALPGYDMLTVAAGYDPVANRTVSRTAENLVRGVLGLVPFGSHIAAKLLELGVLQDAFRMIDEGLTAHRLTLDRIQGDIDRAWAELSVWNGIDDNVAIIGRYVGALYDDAMAFVRGIIDRVLQLIKDAAVGLADTYLAGTPVWDLTKKVLHHDPLRGTPVAATTVEILTDFLTLIGKQDTLAQMQERGTLQQTADWLDAQTARFGSLIGELLALFEAGWDAIQPANVMNLPDNLSKLARDAVALVQRVGAFAADVIAAVLRLVKDSLLGWLSTHAHGIHGFRLLTVIIGQDPFTGKDVPRTAENLIGGFIALLPGGEATYAKLAEAGVIADAGAQIESAISRLGISPAMITETFLGVWNMLRLEDLLNPIGAFVRVLERFGEPLARIVVFAGEVVKVVITLILKLMNFPSELLGSIIANAMAAIEDIKRDPVAFLVNMLEALKSGVMSFLDKVLGYLLTGLTDWLFRGLGALGIQRPADLSLKSILELVLQVLGVTTEMLWQKLGKQIGDDNVAKIRSGLDAAGEAWAFIKDVQENGVAAIWKHVESQLGNLWDTLLSMAKDWIVTEIIEKVTAKLLSMLDPTGIMAVVNSMIAFFKAVQSAIEYLREILAIINDYVTTLAAVAAGNISAGAAKVESGLANAIPVAIGFLANQVGLGNVPEKIVELIKSLRELVDKALDWLFAQAMRLGSAALAALGLGPADPAAGADPAAANFSVHQPVKTVDNEDHEVANRPSTFELTMASNTPTLLSAHHDAGVRQAYADYLAAIAAATSATGKKAAADERLPALIELVKAAGGTAAPRASAPGLGTIAKHTAQQSKLQRGGIRVWWLESEHVIPRGFVNAAFTAHREAGVPAGEGEYNAMRTILIYEQAADRKTGGKEGDASLISAFSTAAREMVQAVEESSQPGAHLAFMANTVRNLFNEYADDAVDRTNDAIAKENVENGAARGKIGSPEPPSPTAAQVAAAADAQIDDIVSMLKKRYAQAGV